MGLSSISKSGVKPAIPQLFGCSFWNESGILSCHWNKTCKTQSSMDASGGGNVSCMNIFDSIIAIPFNQHLIFKVHFTYLNKLSKFQKKNEELIHTLYR